MSATSAAFSYAVRASLRFDWQLSARPINRLETMSLGDFLSAFDSGSSASAHFFANTYTSPRLRLVCTLSPCSFSASTSSICALANSPLSTCLPAWRLYTLTSVLLVSPEFGSSAIDDCKVTIAFSSLPFS